MKDLARVTKSPSMVIGKSVRERLERMVPHLDGATTEHLAEQLVTSVEMVRKVMQALRESGRAHKVKRGNKFHWYPGTCPTLARSKAHPTTAAANRMSRMEGTYLCPELRAQPVRPGAMDAYALPTRGFA